MTGLLTSEMRYRKLTLREKAYLTELLLLVGAFEFLTLAMDNSGWFVMPFFIIIFICGTYLGRLRCPKCGTPIMKNELHLFGFNTHMWKPFPVKRCPDCGMDLTGPDVKQSWSGGKARIRFFWYRELSIRQKALLAEVLLMANLLSAVTSAARGLPRYFVIGGFIGAFVFGIYLLSLRCPKCGRRVVKNELHVPGFRTLIWNPFPRKHCSKCGSDLTETDEKSG